MIIIVLPRLRWIKPKLGSVNYSVRPTRLLLLHYAVIKPTWRHGGRLRKRYGSSPSKTTSSYFVENLQEAQKYAQEEGLMWGETSAKSGEGVAEIFGAIGKLNLHSMLFVSIEAF